MLGMKSKSKIVIIILGFASFFGATLIIYSMWAMTSHGFNMDNLNQIKPGMSIHQVAELMGEPYSTQQLEDGSTVYNYAHDMKWCMGHVRFDQKKLVETKWHDH